MVVLGASDYIYYADREEVVDEEELVNHILLAVLLRVQQLLPLVFLDAFFAELMDVLYKKFSVASETFWAGLLSKLLGIDCYLREQMQILNIAILMNLCDFEVVDLLDHLLELAHNGLNLACVRYPRLVEDRLVLPRLDI